MNVLCFGMPFHRDYSVFESYRGVHNIIVAGVGHSVQLRFDPARDTMSSLVDRLGPTWRPDMAICWFPENHPPPLGIEECPFLTVAVAGDWNQFYPAAQINLSRYDVVLCDKSGVEVYRSDFVNPIHAFPLYAHDPRYHRLMPGIARDIDVLYVGSLNFNHYPERDRWIERLAALSDRYRVVIADAVDSATYGRLLARSKVVFNRSVRGEVNLRVFETLAAGAIAFLEAENQEVRDTLEDEQDVVLYTWDNFEARLARCIDDPAWASTIAARGHARSAEFGPDRRIDQLIEFCITAPQSSRPFRSLSDYEQAYQNFLMYQTFDREPYISLEERLAARLVQMNPTDYRGWAAVGTCFLQAPRHLEADLQRGTRSAKALTKALELAPQSAPCAFNVALAYTWWGQEEKAEPYLESMLRAKTLEGAELMLGGHGSQLWMLWRVLLARGDANLDVLRAEAYAQLARLSFVRAEYPTALHRAEMALELWSDSKSAMQTKSDALWELGRHQEALDYSWQYGEHFSLDLEYRERLMNRLLLVGDVDGASIVADQLRRIRQCIYPKRQVPTLPGPIWDLSATRPLPCRELSESRP